MLCSVFAIVAGASPNWTVLGLFVCLCSFGAGGNLVLDTSVFLEFLPSKDQWLLTLMAAWWGVGQLIAGLLAWAFLPNFSKDCTTVENCTYANNKGWRYVWYTSGSLVFVMSIARITVIKLRETPKFLVGEGRDAECVETLQFIANKYNRPCSLTLAQMEACGTISGRTGSKWSFGEVGVHLKGLYATKRIGISTSLIWLSWTLIGLAYPLYNVFLPTYLRSRSAELGQTNPSIIWRNYTLVNFSGIWGPVLAGYMCSTRLGRKYTMVVGALITMAFFFAYTEVRTSVQDIVFSCVINFFLNIYYGTLYAYTPEVLPSAHRGTGNGIAIGWNRVMGILSAVIATVADVSTIPLLCYS
jgi:MFS family permease